MHSEEFPVQQLRTSTPNLDNNCGDPLRLNRDRNNIPLMGRNALLVKQFKEKSESVIVHELVTAKFNSILNYHYIRSLNRRSFRFRSEEDVNVSMFANLSKNTSKSESFRFHMLTDDEIDAPNGAANTTLTQSNSSLLSAITDNNYDESDYDVRKFLNEALGDQANASLNDFNQSYEDRTTMDDRSISSNELSMLISKATNDFNSTRKLSLESLNMDNTEVFEEKLKQEIDIQNQLITQLSKALDYCDSKKEFICSTEQIEAEKMLLVTNLRKDALMSKLSQIDYNELRPRLISNYGIIEVSNVQFPLKHRSFSNLEPQSDYTNHFLLILSCETTVLFSEIVTDVSDCIKFDRKFQFNRLQSDFKISLYLYCAPIKMTKLSSHNAKYHTKSKTTCPSPKKLFHRVHKYRVSNSMNMFRASPFTLWGQSDIRLPDLQRQHPQRLYNTLVSSSLHGSYFLSVNTKLKLSNRLNGFLTIALKDEAFPKWNRRWCLLEGSTLSYWNYPAEETSSSEPIESFDLTDCTVGYVSAVDRTICAKSRTILLPIRQKDCIRTYLLSADTINEFVDWKTHLNLLLNVLNNWKCLTI